MYNKLINYINKYAVSPLNEEDCAIIKNVFKYRRLRKRQYFLQRDEVCKFFGFIVKGAMRQYSVDDKGNEHVVQLSIENWWVGDRESFTMLTPTVYFIDAWEETELLTLTQTDMLILDRIPAFLEMKAKMDQNHHFALQKRINASISMSAEQRFEELAQRYPEFLQRFPQHVIASYLGISKETLSRVRGGSVKK